VRTLLLVGSTLLLLVHASVNGSVVPTLATSLELSCSVFPMDTSESDLIARFGAGNVTSAPVIGLDDGPSEGTVLFPDRADARLEILWDRRETKRRPAWIMVKGEHSRWRTTNGITLGTDLLTLEQANRRPFRLAGLQSEGQGAVISWAGGRLEAPDTDGCRVTIYMGLRYDGTEDFALMRQVGSSREYSSGHPAMQKLNPRVAVVKISFER
jgi:hypothetical protein